MNEIGRALLTVARDALDRALTGRGDAAARHALLQTPGATFVTLTQLGELRGCVGSLEARRLLQQDVENNACAAAFQDSRFAPLRADELSFTRIEVSLLSTLSPVTFTSEDDLLQRLRPGVDGVVLEWRGRRATFLPQVWDNLNDPRDFIAALKQKAGVPANVRDDGIRVSRYGVDKWKEVQE
jgi:AmmeMemoRadiSam system protein A